MWLGYLILISLSLSLSPSTNDYRPEPAQLHVKDTVAKPIRWIGITMTS